MPQKPLGYSPKEAGYYWYRGATNGIEPRDSGGGWYEGVVLVESGYHPDEGSTANFNPGGMMIYLETVEYMNGDWWGPITPPWKETEQ